MRNYDNLQGGSVARMRAMRAAVEKHNANYGGDKPGRVIDWRIARSHGVGSIKSYANGLNFYNGHAVIPSSVVAAWRDLGDAHGIVRMSHTGWYADAYHDELYVGHVWQLPARNGEPQYVAGYIEPDSGYVVLDCTGNRLDIYNDKEDAARAADSLAERLAEKEREHSERYEAARELENKCEDLRETCNVARSVAKGRIIVLRELVQGSEAWTIASGMVADAREDFAAALSEVIETRATLRAEYGDIA